MFSSVENISLGGFGFAESGGPSVPPSLVMPFDSVDPSDIVLLGGFTLLRSDYVGPLVRIREGAFNTEKDFYGVEQNGRIFVSVAELEAFGTDLYLVTTYGQGVGINWTQPVAGSQLLVSTAADGVYTNKFGIPGARTLAGTVYSCDSDSYQCPRHLTAIDVFSTFDGLNTSAKAGTYQLFNSGGYRNQMNANFTDETLSRVYSSGGASLLTIQLPTLTDPTNGTILSLYYNDDNGNALARSQEFEETASSLGNQRLGPVSNSNYFNRITAFTGPNIQHVSVLLNTHIDRTENEDLLKAAMGI